MQLNVRGVQAGDNNTAVVNVSNGRYEIALEQAGTGSHNAQLTLVNTGSGVATVDWRQTGGADSNAVTLLCGATEGCSLSYSD